MPTTKRGQWSEAFTRRDTELDEFVQSYFPEVAASTLFICGTGFDPRARVIADTLAPSLGIHAKAWLLREERPKPHPSLAAAADQTTAHVQAIFPNASVLRFQVFAEDGALAAGPNMVRSLPLQQIAGISDVILDLSSLSIGIAFPIASWLAERARQGDIRNVHFMIAADSEVDRQIKALAMADQVQSPHDFWRPSQTNAAAAVLWVPQLHHGQTGDLDRIAVDLRPDEIVPLLPFPTRSGRDAEDLIEEYADLLNGWRVDARNVIYAADNDPLDVYRILIRVARERSEVFKKLGRSEVVLTPMGSKVVALGALMAALEEGMSVRYVETLEYSLLDINHAIEASQYEKLSVWLHGGPTWNPL